MTGDRAATAAPPGSRSHLEEAVTIAVRDMVLASPHLTETAGGIDGVDRILGHIRNVWLEVDGVPVHLDHHPADNPRATVVFQPGSGSHARNYFLLGGLLARRGYEVLAIDRPGHGLSGGAHGDCTIGEALAVSQAVIDHARAESDRPVVLMGSSLGGMLTVFALLEGLSPDLAVAHNFVHPGKLASMRLRARWVARFRRKPYPLGELVHGFERLSEDPAVAQYLALRSDPGAAWELTPRSVASLLGHRGAKARDDSPPTLVVTGDRDRAIPAWATRFFLWWSGLPNYEVAVIPEAGHLLFHDHLDRSIPLVADWLDERLGNATGGDPRSRC